MTDAESTDTAGREPRVNFDFLEDVLEKIKVTLISFVENGTA